MCKQAHQNAKIRNTHTHNSTESRAIATASSSGSPAGTEKRVIFNHLAMLRVSVSSLRRGGDTVYTTHGVSFASVVVVICIKYVDANTGQIMQMTVFLYNTQTNQRQQRYSPIRTITQHRYLTRRRMRSRARITNLTHAQAILAAARSRAQRANETHHAAVHGLFFRLF